MFTYRRLLILLALLISSILAAACQPEQIEVVQEVEVTRIVTETVVEAGEAVEVTRLVTEVEEVIVTQEPTLETTGEQPVTLYYNWGSEPPTLDPALATDSTSLRISTNMFMGLTRADPTTGEVLPSLATDWDVSEDGTVYTFHMRDDVPWVNYNPEAGQWSQVVDEAGNPRFVNAYDVEYGVKRTIDPATASDYAYALYIIANAEAVNSGQEDATVDSIGVQALDEHTVQFTLEAPASYFPSISSLWVAYPQPQWAIEEWGPKWTEAGLIVTNGPYGLEEWVHGGSLNLVKSPLWPEADSVQIERIEGVMINEESTEFAMYENNELDSVPVPVADIDRVKADPTYDEELYIAPAPCTEYYGFANNKPPFDDARVRRAFVQAIDRQSLVDNVTKAGEIPATSFAPPGIFGAPEPGTVGLAYDGQAAQASLQEYLDENGMTIDDFNAMGISLMYNTSESLASVAGAIQQMWRDVLGVEVRAENQEWKVYLDTIGNETPLAEMPHIFRLGWCADYADENNWVHQVFNATASSNPLRRNCLDDTCTQAEPSEFDELTAAAGVETDPARRQEMYARAEEILAVDEAAYAPLFHYSDVILAKPWLQRTYAVLALDPYNEWTIDQAAQLEARGE